MRNEMLRTEKVMVRLTPVDYARLSARAQRERRSLSSMVDVIVSEALREEGQLQRAHVHEARR